MVDEIQRLENRGVVSPGEVAIMYRTNAQSRILEETFVARGLPYLLVRGTRFYDRREVKDALAYLRLLHNPEDSVSLNRIINVPAPGHRGQNDRRSGTVGPFRLGTSPWQAIQRLVAEAAQEISPDDTESPSAPFKSRARKSLTTFGQMINMLLSAKSKLSLPELFDLTIARTGYKTFVKDNTPEGDERWDNLQELRARHR